MIYSLYIPKNTYSFHTNRYNYSLVLTSFRLASTGNWILDGGFWNDNGVWVDSESWED